MIGAKGKSKLGDGDVKGASVDKAGVGSEWRGREVPLWRGEAESVAAERPRR